MTCLDPVAGLLLGGLQSQLHYSIPIKTYSQAADEAVKTGLYLDLQAVSCCW